MRRCALAVSLALGLAAPAQAQGGELSLALVLAVDASGSVDAEEFALQVEGLAAAFRDPQVVAAIGQAGPLAVSLMQWSSPGQQKLIVNWRRIADRVSAARFADAIVAAGRLIEGETAIAPALRFAIELLESSGLQAARRVIDLSGDGISNWGDDPGVLRDAAVAAGITINGLAIINEQPDLADYYHRHVIGGSGAFLVKARDYADFARAIRSKLIREIEGTPVGSNETGRSSRGPG